jgi:trimethylamine:corrinoid methyltransferase-like protein
MKRGGRVGRFRAPKTPLEKLKSTLGKDTVKEMEAMSEEKLKQVVMTANKAMIEVVDELEKNEAYQEIKSKKTAIESGKKEVDKRQKARIKFSICLLEEKGKV